MKHNKNPFSAPRSVQLWLFGLAGLLAIVQIVLSAQYLLLAYPGWEGFRISAWSLYSIGGSVFPLLFFSLAYWLGSRTSNKWQRSFDGLVFTLFAVAMGGFLMATLTTFGQPLPMLLELAWLSSWMYILPSIMALIILLGVLLALRPKQGSGLKVAYSLALLGSAYVFFILEYAVSLLQLSMLQSHDIISIIRLSSLLAASIVLAVITYLLIPSKQLRIYKTLTYMLLPGLAYFLLFTLTMNFSLSNHPEWQIPLEYIGFGILVGIPLVYIIFLVIAFRQKNL